MKSSNYICSHKNSMKPLICCTFSLLFCTGRSFSLQASASDVSNAIPGRAADGDATIYESLQSQPRDLRSTLDWAQQHGVVFHENWMQLTPVGHAADEAEAVGWGYFAVQDIPARTKIMTVPTQVHFASSKIYHANRQEQSSTSAATEAVAFQTAYKHIAKHKLQDQIPQFIIFVELLRHFLRDASMWSPWLQSLPKTFDTATCMTEDELECLPPRAWALASIEIQHLKVFRSALQLLPDAVVPRTNLDDELIRYAFNVVFTRCWSYPKQSQLLQNATLALPHDPHFELDDLDLVPMGDIFNHNVRNNAVVTYDSTNGDAVFVTTQPVPKGAQLTLSYGVDTIPYRWLIVFGFVDTEQPEIYCDWLATNPTQRHVDVGYDTERMVFRTSDGAISQPVWDVVLYSILEQVPQIQDQFYDALVVRKDVAMQQYLHQRYIMETSIILRKHVVRTLQELQQQADRIAALLLEENDTARQSRLPLIQTHVQFLQATYRKVKLQIDFRMQTELQRRKESQQDNDGDGNGDEL